MTQSRHIILKLLQWMSVAQDRQFDRSQQRSTAMKSMLPSMAVVLTCVARLQQRLRSFRRLAARPVAKIDSGAGTGVIGEETGITRNVKGEDPFHDMSVRCLYHWSVALLALFGHPPALRNVRYRG